MKRRAWLSWMALASLISLIPMGKIVAEDISPTPQSEREQQIVDGMLNAEDTDRMSGDSRGFWSESPPTYTYHSDYATRTGDVFISGKKDTALSLPRAVWVPTLCSCPQCVTKRETQ